MIERIFSNEAQLDLRQPIANVAVPSWITSILLSPHQRVDFDILMPDIYFWIQWGITWIVQSIIMAVLGYLAHIFVLSKERSPAMYLIGYGIFVPLILSIPFHLVTWLNIMSPVMKLAISVQSALSAFRCMGAMHGTIPKDLGTNAATFCVYCTSVVDTVTDEKGKRLKATSNEIKKYWNRFLISYVMVGMMLTILDTLSQDWKMFKYEPSRFVHFLHFKHLMNNFAITYLQYLILLSGTSATAAITALMTGYKVYDATIDPLLSSSSPSDFWGRRWNNIVHRAMKIGIYKPLKQFGVGAMSSATAVFFISGLFHEYILSVVDFSRDDNGKRIVFGAQTAFFMWNAGVVMIEYLLRTRSGMSYCWLEGLPKIVISLLVVMTVLPISHWFSDQMISVELFSDYKRGFPAIIFHKS